MLIAPQLLLINELIQEIDTKRLKPKCCFAGKKDAPNSQR